MSKLVLMTQIIEQLACKNKTIYKLARIYYRSIVSREVALARITDKDFVLCIGGGPCPFSGIMIHEMTGARVTIIDYDKNCTNHARMMVETLGYKEKIDVLCQDGCEITDFPYSTVHLAAQLSPMDRIFSRIKKASRDGTKVLVRLPRCKLSSLYCPIKNNSLSQCPRTLHGTTKNLESTALYVKTISA